MRKAIAVEQRLSVAVWFLATPCEYRIIAHLFGIARFTVCEIVQETCATTVKSLLHKYIKFPYGNKIDDLVDGFKTKWGVLQCIGAVDGCSSISSYDYFNRKGWYSIVLQGVVHHSYWFPGFSPEQILSVVQMVSTQLYKGVSDLLPSPPHTQKIFKTAHPEMHHFITYFDTNFTFMTKK